MVELLRSRITVVWLVLIGLTLLSWWMGASHGLGADGHSVAAIVVLVVAFAKVRLVGRYFMELRDAPWPLLVSFELYCLVVCVMVVAFLAVSL